MSFKATDISPTKHIMNNNQSQHLLITGYFRRMLINYYSNRMQQQHISSNILIGVYNYFGIDYGISFNLCLLSISNRYRTNKLKLFSMSQMKQYDVQISNAHSKHQPFIGLNTANRSICTINNTSLPIPFRKQLAATYSLNTSIKDKWSIVTFIGGGDGGHLSPSSSICDICAFPKSNIPAFSFSDKQIVNGDIDCFGFMFPSLPQSMYGLSTIYDKYNNMIYAMNPWSCYSTSIFSSNLNGETIDSMSWKEISNGLLMSRSNTSICMVDKGRFIAIMGGKGRYQYKGIQTKGTELYAINANKSIKLSLMNRFSENGASIYNEELHNIIIGDSIGFQLYDINKDKWHHLYDRYYNSLENESGNNKPKIWISRSNPFIYYFSGYKMVKSNCKWTGEINECKYMMERFDIRQYTKKQIVRLQDVSWESLAHYNEILSFQHLKPRNTKVVHLAF